MISISSSHQNVIILSLITFILAIVVFPAHCQQYCENSYCSSRYVEIKRESFNQSKDEKEKIKISRNHLIELAFEVNEFKKDYPVLADSGYITKIKCPISIIDKNSTNSIVEGMRGGTIFVYENRLISLEYLSSQILFHNFIGEISENIITDSGSLALDKLSKKTLGINPFDQIKMSDSNPEYDKKIEDAVDLQCRAITSCLFCQSDHGIMKVFNLDCND